VWIEAQSPGESEMRYAIIWDYRTPNDGNPYEEPFFQTVARAGMDDFILTLEREPYWRANVPGTGTAIETSAVEIYVHPLGNVNSIGTRQPTTADEVYVANKRNVANITNVHYWDSNANNWSANLMVAGLPFAMLPNPILADDVVVFGINTALPDSGPFCSLVFDIGTAMTLVTGTQWKYSSVGADPTVNWNNLTVQDNTDQDGAMTGMPFDTLGVGSVHWEQPAAWTEQNPTVNAVALGVTGYWVAMDIVTVAGADTPPWQQNRDIYSIVWPYIEIDPATTADVVQVGGDAPTLAQYKTTSRSDHSRGVGAPPADEPTLWSDRLICGLRSLSRGAAFTAYINLANEQNPAGITITAGLGAFTVNTTTASGVYVLSGILVANYGRQVTITLGPTMIPSYAGTFHMYLRAQQVGGAAGDVNVDIRITHTTSADGFNFFTKRVSFESTNDWRLLDFGQISLPGFVLNSSDNVNAVRIEIWANDDTASAARRVRLYDLVLIPVDEWAYDSNNPGRYIESILGRDATDGRRTLDIDGITLPKRDIRSPLRIEANDYIEQEWRTITPSGPIMQANASQRLWFLSVRDEQGHHFAENWFCEPWVAFSTQTFNVQRYLSMRGDR